MTIISHVCVFKFDMALTNLWLRIINRWLLLYHKIKQYLICWLRYIGLEGEDSLQGSSADDLIFGDEGNDALVGTDGNDKIFGGK